MNNINDVWLAYERIKPYIRKTPLEYSSELSNITNANVFLKMECWQHTGSFKPRGAFNCLQMLSLEQRKKGVIAPTAGNHGLGLSYAAQKIGVPVHIYLPESTDSIKIDLLRKLNAKVNKFPDIETARLEALNTAKTQELKFISAYNDLGMICGGASIAIELLQDLSSVDIVIVCVGGGGLISGVASFLKSQQSFS